MITTAFIQKLLATSGVTAHVGNRIQPNVIKAETPLPAMYVFSDQMTKQACYNPSGTMEGTVEIGIRALDYSQARNIMLAVRNALDDFTGIVNNVGIMVMRGEETVDEYNEESETHMKVINYQAVAEPK